MSHVASRITKPFSFQGLDRIRITFGYVFEGQQVGTPSGSTEDILSTFGQTLTEKEMTNGGVAMDLRIKIRMSRDVEVNLNS
jgi:hypothetical protein